MKHFWVQGEKDDQKGKGRRALAHRRGWPQKKKARSLSTWVRQAIRAVVSVPYKATGVSALTPAPVITSTSPRARTHSKSLRSPDISRHGAN